MINGVCRICGCTDVLPCTLNQDDDSVPLDVCQWMDEAHTLCSNPRCVANVPLQALLDIVFPRLPHQLEARR
jgi:hypothetical protein